MLSLLFDLFKTERKVGIGGVELDATIRELHDRSSVVTENPVEVGGVITDHAYNLPERLTITGEITDTPVMMFGGFFGLFAERNRSQSAYNKLVELHEALQPLSVVTRYQVYSNMIMTDLTVDRNVTTGRRLQFTAGFKRINYVGSRLVALPPEVLASTQSKLAQSAQNLGRKTTEVVTNPQVLTRSKSVLSSMFGG